MYVYTEWPKKVYTHFTHFSGQSVYIFWAFIWAILYIYVCVCVNLDVFNNWQATVISLDEF